VGSDETTGQLRADRNEASRALVIRREDLNQLVLDLLARPPGKSFGELADAWFQRIAPTRVCPDNERRHLRHLAPLASLREGELTKGRIEELFGQLRAPAGKLSSATLNKVRGTGRLVIADAQGNGEWRGPNPFELVRRQREAKRLYVTLTLPEVALVLPHLRTDRRRLVKAILLVGMRPGEALGLKKEDVDLAGKLLRVRRSHGRNQTKTGKEREFPIPEELVQDLRDAIAESSGEYVFPKRDGTRQRKDTKLTRVIRAALVAAGLVTGYRYICRRKDCRYEETRQAKEQAQDCPKCGFRLWVSPIPKALRFYDLRHSSATLHRKAGCDPLVIQEVLGHTSNITDGTYTHLDEDYRRFEINKLKLV
jgi:integrase